MQRPTSPDSPPRLTEFRRSPSGNHFLFIDEDDPVAIATRENVFQKESNESSVSTHFKYNDQVNQQLQQAQQLQQQLQQQIQQLQQQIQQQGRHFRHNQRRPPQRPRTP